MRCKYFHEYDELNTIWVKAGKDKNGDTKYNRRCRQCSNKRRRDYYRKSRAAAKAANELAAKKAAEARKHCHCCPRAVDLARIAELTRRLGVLGQEVEDYDIPAGTGAFRDSGDAR